MVFPRLALVVALLLLGTAVVRAEPYLAVQEGLQCSACHSNPAGGGKRTAFGNIFSQTGMPARTLGNTEDFWNGQVTEWFSVGANLRGGLNYVDTPNQDTTSEFAVNRGRLYLEANVIRDRLSVYIDQQFAPDASINREAYIRFNTASRKWQLFAGQFFLPYGLRLQDDTAFTRLVTGVNFFTPDRGVMLGYESGSWSTQISLTNGSGGGGDDDDQKQVSAVIQYVRPQWRAGASANINDTDFGDRRMANVFGGVRTGPISWLGEINAIEDDDPALPSRDSIAGLIEGNWLLERGHNLKATYEYYDPDRDTSEDHQVRWSLIWEYTPIQFLQARFGYRAYDGIPQSDVQNRDEAFIELHGFF